MRTRPLIILLIALSSCGIPKTKKYSDALPPQPTDAAQAIHAQLVNEIAVAQSCETIESLGAEAQAALLSAKASMSSDGSTTYIVIDALGLDYEFVFDAGGRLKSLSGTDGVGPNNDLISSCDQSAQTATSTATSTALNAQSVTEAINSIQLGQTLETMPADAKNLIEDNAKCAPAQNCILDQWAAPNNWDFYFAINFDQCGNVINIYNGVTKTEEFPTSLPACGTTTATVVSTHTSTSTSTSQAQALATCLSGARRQVRDQNSQLASELASEQNEIDSTNAADQACEAQFGN